MTNTITRLPTVPGSERSAYGGFPYMPSFDDVVRDLELDGLFPLPEFSHQQFLRDLDQAGWLEEWEASLEMAKLGLLGKDDRAGSVVTKRSKNAKKR